MLDLEKLNALVARLLEDYAGGEDRWIHETGYGSKAELTKEIQDYAAAFKALGLDVDKAAQDIIDDL